MFIDNNWFLAIVDSIDDPKKLGRVKVRVLDEVNEDISSEDLPWAIVLGSTTNASLFGVGQSIVGMVPGTRVIGLYLDGDKKTKPLIMGTMPFIKDGNDSDHSFSSISRGNGPVQKNYLEYEPNSAYAAEYPHNKTLTTKSGHVIEIDDTPKAERIHIYHKSGAYIEIFPDGKIVTKSPKDNIEICIGDKILTSDDGEIFIAAKKNISSVSSEGDNAVIAEKDVGIISKSGSVGISASNKLEIESSDTSIKSDTLIEGDLEINGDVNIKGEVNITGSLKVNGRPVDLK